MLQRNVRVAVIGGGIMGASAAWHLARMRVKVLLIERHPALEHGVTASSYGWVGTSAHLPSNGLAAFALRLQAIQEFARLEQDLGSLPLAARGALAWYPTEEATAALIAEQQAAGVRVEGLARASITDREPRSLPWPLGHRTTSPGNLPFSRVSFSHRPRPTER